MSPLRFLIAASVLTLVGAPALAQDKMSATPEGGRMISVVVFGDDPCPQSTDDEIVVCARLPEKDRYRLPQRFRGRKAAEAAGAQSWTNRVESVETVSRIGTPNSCSPVGSGGFTGCTTRLLREFRAERRAAEQP